MKVRVVLFIKKSGWIGKNKLVDMEKENKVKFLKEFIRGFGFNKIVGIFKVV